MASGTNWINEETNMDRFERLAQLARQGWKLVPNPQTGNIEAMAPSGVQRSMRNEAQEQLDKQLLKKKMNEMMIPSPDAAYARQKILGNPNMQAKLAEQAKQSLSTTESRSSTSPTLDTGVSEDIYSAGKRAIEEDPFYMDFKKIGMANLKDAGRNAELYSKLQQVGRGVPLNSLVATHNALFPQTKIAVKGADNPTDVAANQAGLALKIAGTAEGGSKNNLYYQTMLEAMRRSMGQDKVASGVKEEAGRGVTVNVQPPAEAKAQKRDTSSDSYNTEFRKSVMKSALAAEAAAKDTTNLVKVLQEGDIGTIKRQIGEFATMNGESAARFSDADARRYIPSSVLSQIAQFEKYLTGTGSIKGTAEQKQMIKSLIAAAQKWKSSFPENLNTFRNLYKPDSRWSESNEEVLRGVEPQILKQFPKTEYDDNDVKAVMEQAKGKGLALTPEQASKWIEENYGRIRKAK